MLHSAALLFFISMLLCHGEYAQVDDEGLTAVQHSTKMERQAEVLAHGKKEAENQNDGNNETENVQALTAEMEETKAALPWSGTPDPRLKFAKQWAAEAIVKLQADTCSNEYACPWCTCIKGYTKKYCPACRCVYSTGCPAGFIKCTKPGNFCGRGYDACAAKHQGIIMAFLGLATNFAPSSKVTGLVSKASTALRQKLYRTAAQAVAVLTKQYITEIALSLYNQFAAKVKAEINFPQNFQNHAYSTLKESVIAEIMWGGAEETATAMLEKSMKKYIPSERTWIEHIGDLAKKYDVTGIAGVVTAFEGSGCETKEIPDMPTGGIYSIHYHWNNR